MTLVHPGLFLIDANSFLCSFETLAIEENQVTMTTMYRYIGISDDFFVVKKSGLSQAQALSAYLGGSAFQTIMDNPVTAYRQLVQQYAKDVTTGKPVDPKIASQQAQAVFRSHPVQRANVLWLVVDVGHFGQQCLHTKRGFIVAHCVRTAKKVARMTNFFKGIKRQQGGGEKGGGLGKLKAVAGKAKEKIKAKKRKGNPIECSPRTGKKCKKPDGKTFMSGPSTRLYLQN